MDAGKRRAFYIVGPESSGTRMLIKSFIRVGVHGDAGHTQTMDCMDFSNFPDDIVFRQSIPHGRCMPLIGKITSRIESFDYKVFHVVIDREDKYLLLSKVKRGHQPDMGSAVKRLPRERKYIAEQMKDMGVQPALVQYENFVGSAEARRKFFEAYSLPEPNMYFWNANDTYE